MYTYILSMGIRMSSREPQPRACHAAVDFRQKLYIWGGFGFPAKIQASMVETFDVPSETWQQPQEIRGSLPDHLGSMAVARDNENAYFFGGSSGSSPNFTFTYYNTLYQLNLSTLECKELVPRNPSQAPVKQAGSGMVLFKDKLVVHGEYTGKDLSNELHIFDLKNSVWSVQTTTGDKPPPLSVYTFTRIDHHRAVVYGGYTGTDVLNDVYVLDMEKWHWTKLNIPGAKPPVRKRHAACCIAGPLTGQQHPLLMVVAGYHAPNMFGDVWLLDVDNMVWNEVNLPVAITPRNDHSAVLFGYGPTFRLIVLFGGFNFSDVLLSETTLLIFELSGGSWQVTRVVKPDELGKPDERLRQQMRKLELSPTPKSTPPTSGAEAKKGPIIDVNEIQVGQRLGQGGFGAVYEAKWKKKKVAVKVCLGNLLQNLSREIEILASLPSHPNVVTFFGVALSSDSINTYIITELAPNGSLHNYMHVKGENPSPEQGFAWALQVASGMQHLHSNNVVHRDLKSGNILLSFGMFAKVCDFGTARTLAKTAVTSQKGTYRWMAPEIVEGVEANINKMCDVFSFGMVMYEIYACKIPYDDLLTDPLVGMAVLQGKRPPIPPTLPSFLHPLLQACWNKEPRERPQFEAIVIAMQTESFE